MIFLGNVMIGIKEDYKSQSTLSVLNDLSSQGVDSYCLLLRHSQRHYDAFIPEDIFHSLTEDGKQASYDLGLHFRKSSNIQFYSSPIIRCVETSYQIEKGCLEQGISTSVTKIDPNLLGMYIRDRETYYSRLAQEGLSSLLSAWFSGDISEYVMMPAEEAKNIHLSWIKNTLLSTSKPCVHIGVTHDWNLHLLRKLCLGQDTATLPQVGFLEGIVFFEKENKFYAINEYGGPKEIILPLTDTSLPDGTES